MIDTRDLCINCFSRKGSGKQCPKCGYVDGTPAVAPYLAPGTVLAGRYIVGKNESLSGEGVTYLGYDAEKNAKVIIREYLPLTLCSRKTGDDNVIINEGDELVYGDYLQDFFDISKAVSRLNDVPAIVPLRAIFECNNTAYAVYERPDGVKLTDIIKRAGRLSWEEARPLFMPLIAAMNSAHSLGLVHFGICPDNVYFNHDRKLHIAGFAIPDSRMTETTLKCDLNDGFSAIEQYSAEGKRGKFSDVYSVCALMFYALTGNKPATAVKRSYEPRLNVPAELAETIPSHVLAAIAGGLQVAPENRTQTMEELRNQLNPKGSSNSARRAPAAAPVRRERPPRPEMQRQRTAPASQQSFGEKSKDFVKEMGEKLGNFGKLKQWQYWLLSLIVSIVVLGIIAIVILSIFKPLMENSSGNSAITPPEPYISNQSASDKQMYEIPDLVGKNWEKIEADTKADYYMFDFVVLADRVPSDEYDEGEIVAQSPDASQGEASYDSVIALTLSAGSESVKIPKIVGKTVYEAQQALDKAGLHMGEQTTRYSDEYDFGEIIEISNGKEGGKVAIDSYVNVVVSAGPEPQIQIIGDEGAID